MDWFHTSDINGALDIPEIQLGCQWYICVNYNDLTTTSLEIMVSKGNHPQLALIQGSEIL
jgi:hypothetical protein